MESGRARTEILISASGGTARLMDMEYIRGRLGISKFLRTRCRFEGEWKD